MKRIIAGAIALALSLSVVPMTAANAAPTTCGTLCTQTIYDNADLGAWFIDGEDELLLADYYGFRVISTFSQKTTFRFDLPSGSYIDHFAVSANAHFVVMVLDGGVVYRYNTEDWSRTVINDGVAITDIRQLAVSSNGEEVYVARNPNSGSAPSSVLRFHQGELTETFTSEGTDYGIYALVVDDLDANLYIGWNGNSPTFAKLDATDIASGVIASDDSGVAWGATSIAVAADGTVFGGSPDIAVEGVYGAEYPHVLKMNGTTLAVTDTIDSTQDWRGWEIALSDNDDLLYAASYFLEGSPSDPDERNKIDVINASTFAIEQTLVFPTLAAGRIENLDVHSTGNYLVAAMDGDAYIVSLDSSPVTLSAEIFAMDDTTSIVDWQYTYLNPKAKFLWFEVKYYPVGKRKAVVKRVKRATAKEIGQVKPGTDVRVRAVYTKKRLNTAWVVAEFATP